MALATTTLASALGVNDNSIVVASATSIASGRIVVIDGEQMTVAAGYTTGTTVAVIRGTGGTRTEAHASGANVTHGLASDFTAPAPGNSPVNWPNIRSVVCTSYSATGAIALPVAGSDLRVILNGTSALAMTVAAPTKDLDFCRLTIIGNGKSASTVTFSGGLGAAGAGYTVVTAQNAGQVGFEVMAANGAWVALNAPFTGTSTKLSVALS